MKNLIFNSISVVIRIAIIVLIFGSHSLFGGNGQFKNGKYKFCVSVRFNATAAQLAQIRGLLEDGSQILADATDGQQQFDKVTIVNDSGASKSAEYWIHSGSGGAYATAGRYGVRGQHVNFFYDTYFGPRSGSHPGCPGAGAIGSAATAYSIAHEHAHHAWGVRDEYVGSGGAAECAAAADTAALNFSLMDNYYCRGGRAAGGGYTLNEFCVASNHDPDGDTGQDEVHGTSIWETIAAHPNRSATAPAGLPTDAPPGAHTVTFADGFGGLRVMLLLDRSGSMSVQQRLVFAKRGGKTFLTFLRNGDGVGVASFSSSSSVNFPLTEITGSATKDSAKAAIDSLTAGGLTNIGGGLLTALSQITSQSDRSCNEIIVLLSDGDHNTGTPPSAAIQQLKDEGVTAFTVGVGSGISSSGQATLQNIASQTGGRYFRAANSFQLVGLFLRLAMESIGNGLLTRDPLLIQSGEVVEIPILVELGSSTATFAMSFLDQTDDLMLELVTPSGVVITEADAVSNPDIDFLPETNNIAFQVRNPEPGVWKMVVSAGAVNSGVIELLAFSENDGVDLNVAVEDDEVVFPQAVQIEASPTFAGQNVIGVVVNGVVVRPDGSEVPIELLDDGENQDTQADDGVYTATFNQYNDDGTYSFELTAVNSGGTLYAGEGLEAVLAPGPPIILPDFVRSSSATAVVTGVPDFVTAIVEYGPETINLKSRGRFVTAYIELPDGFDPGDISVASLAVTAVDNNPVTPIPAQSRPTELGDFDNDGVPDLMVKFSRQQVQQVLSPGMRTIRLEGFVGGQLLVGERGVAVISPGR